MRKFYLLALTLISLSAVSQQVRTLKGGGNRSWGTTNDWTGNAPPSNGDTVRLTRSVTLTGNFNYTTLYIDIRDNGELLINTGSLTLSATSGIVQVHSGGEIVSVNKTSADKIAIGGVDKFLGSATYTFNGNTTPGVVVGPAYASNSTGSGSNGFILGILPVTLSSFKAHKLAQSVELSWSTEFESNSGDFIIERSNEGKNWSSIGSVKAAGNSTEKRSYSYADKAPLTGANFYRLKIVDIDGLTEYSKVQVVNVTSGGLMLQVFPNPAVSTVKVIIPQTYQGEQVQVSIVNRMGQVVARKRISANSNLVEFNVGQLAEGNYLVRAVSGTKWSETVSLVIGGK